MTPRIHGRRRRGEAAARPGGFTLVELLVVISIIALLIGILLPSLKKARAVTKSTVCKAHLRGVGQAFAMYAENFDGVWPPAVDSLGSQNRWPVPFHLAGIIAAKYGAYNTAGKELRNPDDSVFICPAEKAERIIPNWTVDGVSKPVDRVEVGGSYAMNEEIHRKPDGTLFRGMAPPPAPGQPPYMTKVDHLRRTAEVFVIMDNFRPLEQPGTPGWRFNRGAQESPAGSGAFAVQQGGFWTGYHLYDGTLVVATAAVDKLKIIGGRHSGTGNGLCADTHVESYIPDQVPYNRVSWARWPLMDKTPPGGR